MDILMRVKNAIRIIFGGAVVSESEIDFEIRSPASGNRGDGIMGFIRLRDDADGFV